MKEWFFGFYFKTISKIQVDPMVDKKHITIENKNPKTI